MTHIPKPTAPTPPAIVAAPVPPPAPIAAPAAPRALPVAPKPPQFVPKPQGVPTNIPTLEPNTNQPKPSPPRMPTAPILKGAPKQAPQRRRSPSEGACDNYQLDLSGDSFGVCVCGFNKIAHNQPKDKSTNRRSLVAKTPTQKQAKPCNQYRVDLAGKNFGDCACGWGKVEHAKIEAMQPSYVKPVPEPEKEPDPNDVVEMAFDQETANVFNMMVQSYIEQHGQEPDEEAKLDWASNLAILSAGKEKGPNAPILRIRAKNLPKNKNKA